MCESIQKTWEQTSNRTGKEIEVTWNSRWKVTLPKMSWGLVSAEAELSQVR